MSYFMLLLCYRMLFILFTLGNVIKLSKATQTFSIGGLFHQDGRDIEFAFKYAIDFYNLHNSDDIFFEPHIRYIPKKDIFAASKVVCKMLEEDSKLVVIFGPPSPQVAPIIRSVCSNFQIPNVQTYWTGYYPPSKTSINVYPEWQVLADGLATIIQHLHWNTYIVLYENDESLMRLQGVMKDPTQHLILKQISSNRNDRLLLKEIKQMKHKAIIIECSEDRMLDVLVQAQEIGLTKDYSYFLSSLDAHTLDIDHIGFDQDNITTVRVVDPTNANLIDVVQHWNAQQIWSNSYRTFPNKVKFDVALMHDAVIFFATAFAKFKAPLEISPGQVHCRNDTKWEEGLEIGAYLQEHAIINGLTGHIKLNGNARSSLSLQVIRMMKKEKHALGYWASSNPTEYYYYMRSDAEVNREISEQYHGRTLIVSSRIGRPYLMNKSNSSDLSGNDQFEGYALDLIDHISKIVNFTYEFRLAADGKYGNYVPANKSWNGLIKDLLDGTADLAICDLTITHERRAVVDFTMPFMTLGISILHSKPSPKERNIFAFMDPIDTVVWIYIVTAYISVTLILYAITRMAPGDWESTDPISENPEELENIWGIKIAFGLLLDQPCHRAAIFYQSLSSRMATSMWWFFILIISSSYTANLAAFLTTDRMGPAINNAEALAKQTKIKYGTMADGSTQAFFRNSNYSTYKRMWTQMEQAKPSVFENTNADGVKRVKTTKNQLYAFLMESSSIEYEIARDCELKQVGGQLDSKGYGIALPLNSPLRKQINNAILELQEDGKLLALKVKWWKEMYGGNMCDEEKSEAPSSDLELALSNVGGVFVVIGVGLAIAFLISISEFVGNIYTVSIQDHKSFCTVALNEFKFALQVWIVKKDASTVASDGDVSSDSNENSNSPSNDI